MLGNEAFARGVYEAGVKSRIFVSRNSQHGSDGDGGPI